MQPNQTLVETQKQQRGLNYNHNQTAIADQKPRRILMANANQSREAETKLRQSTVILNDDKTFVSKNA
jgi:hypothetical protein